MDKTMIMMMVGEAEDRFREEIETLANKRLQLAVDWFKAKYPKWRLKIIFGMGTDVGEVNGRTVYFEHVQSYDGNWNIVYSPQVFAFVDDSKGKPRGRAFKCLQPLADAIADVREICDGYARGCPSDVYVNMEAGDGIRP